MMTDDGQFHDSFYAEPMALVRTTCRKRRASKPKRAFSLAETVVGVLLVGVLLVASLNAAGASRLGQKSLVDRGRGTLLAEELLNEILVQHYEEPVDSPSFGRELSESGGSREEYDDVDDYHEWSSSPPKKKDGTTLSGFSEWSREVIVAFVDPTDVSAVVPMDQGAKRIVVSVKQNGRQVAALTAIRTRGTDECLEVAP